LDSRQGPDVSLLHNVQTGSGAHPASLPMSTGALSPEVKTFASYNVFKYNAIINFSSSLISYRIPSNAGYFC
jgi:hypothetical protein